MRDLNPTVWGVLMDQSKPLLKASSTEVRSIRITASGSCAPKTELPATMQLAPALAAASIVEGPSPPSTYSSHHLIKVL